MVMSDGRRTDVHVHVEQADKQFRTEQTKTSKGHTVATRLDHAFKAGNPARSELAYTMILRHRNQSLRRAPPAHNKDKPLATQQYCNISSIINLSHNLSYVSLFHLTASVFSSRESSLLSFCGTNRVKFGSSHLSPLLLCQSAR